jgi:hypothetical protein
VKFLDALLGRSRPVRSKLESMMGISTAAFAFAASNGLESTGSAGICFRSLSSSQFAELQRELAELLDVSGKATGTDTQIKEDSFGYHWVVLGDPDFEDLVTTIHMVSLTLTEHGFRDQLLAAAFHFEDAEDSGIYWIYNYKRGTFYPFAPTGARARDNALELRMQAVADGELPLETDQSKWYALWELPV